MGNCVWDRDCGTSNTNQHETVTATATRSDNNNFGSDRIDSKNSVMVVLIVEEHESTYKDQFFVVVVC